MTDLEKELLDALKATRAAIEYAITFYVFSPSAEAEILSHINGYCGSPEVDKLLTKLGAKQ